MKRFTHLEHAARLSALTLLTIGILALLGVGCRRGIPVVDPSPGIANASGTVSGTVRSPQGTGAIDGRLVELVNIETGEVQRASTSNIGGFTFRVAPGRYRVKVAVLDGEKILKAPGEIQINRSDVDTHADFIVGNAKIARPAHRQQHDPALGQPTA